MHPPPSPATTDFTLIIEYTPESSGGPERQQRPERSKTERGIKGHGLALLAGAYTVFFLERDDLGTSLLLSPGKMFRQVN